MGMWIRDRSEIQTQVVHCLSVFRGPQWAKGSAQEKGHQKYLPNQMGWGLAARQALDRGTTVFGPPSSLWFSTLASIPVLCQEHPPFTSPCPYDRLFDILQVFASTSPSHWERPWPFLNCSPSPSSCFSITSFTFLCSILLLCLLIVCLCPSQVSSTRTEILVYFVYCHNSSAWNSACIDSIIFVEWMNKWRMTCSSDSALFLLGVLSL